MLVAHEKRKSNIAEYILYMWQIEDLLRACAFHPETIHQHLVNRFQTDDSTKKQIADWYLNLAMAMEKEQIQEKGHLMAISNLVNDLNEFHLKMIEIQKDQEYFNLYKLNKSAIDELMQRSEMNIKNEVEACLNMLYGIMLLKLKNTEITETTKNTVDKIARMIGHLSTRYIQFENDDFEF